MMVYDNDVMMSKPLYIERPQSQQQRRRRVLGAADVGGPHLDDLGHGGRVPRKCRWDQAQPVHQSGPELRANRLGMGTPRGR